MEAFLVHYQSNFFMHSDTNLTDIVATDVPYFHANISMVLNALKQLY